MADRFIHPQALCESQQIGAGTRVEAFAHVLPGARLGLACSIGGHAVVGEGAMLGDRVILQGGVQVAAGVRLEDDVVVGCNAVFSQDGPARDEVAASPTLVRAGASISEPRTGGVAGAGEPMSSSS